MKKVLIITCLIFLIGDSYGISLSAEIGFSGYYKVNSWTPIKIYLKNEDNKEFYGKIKIPSKNYVFYRDIYLKPYESKSIEMEIFIEDPKNDIEIFLIEESGRSVKYVANAIPVRRYIVLSDVKINLSKNLKNNIILLNLDERKIYGSADAIISKKLTDSLKEYACLGGNLVLISHKLSGKRLHENVSKVKFGNGYIFYANTRDIDFLLENFVLSVSNYETNYAPIYVDLRRKIDFLYISALFIIYIAIIGPVNYIILRRKKKLEYAWFTIPALAVAFSFLSYSIGYLYSSGSLEVYESGTVVPCGDKALVDQIITIYTPKKEKNFVSADVRRLARISFEKKKLDVYEDGFMDTFYMWSSKRYRNIFVLNKSFNINSSLYINGKEINGYINSSIPLSNAVFTGYTVYKHLGNITELSFNASFEERYKPIRAFEPMNIGDIPPPPMESMEPRISGYIDLDTGVGISGKNFTKKTRYRIIYYINNVSFSGKYNFGVIYRIPYVDAGFFRFHGTSVEIDEGTFIAVAEPILSIYGANISKITLDFMHKEGLRVWIFNWREGVWDEIKADKIEVDAERYLNGVIKLKFSYSGNNIGKIEHVLLPKIMLEVEKL